jgi:ABC-2 type transport system ATP-binding protein
VIRNLQSENKTILLTTHYMFEADALCQRIAVIDQGRIIALDTPGGLKEVVADLSVVEIDVFGMPPEMLKNVESLPFVETVSIENRDQRQVLLVQSPQGSEIVPQLMTALNGARLGKVIVREPTLEDAYVRLVSTRKQPAGLAA